MFTRMKKAKNTNEKGSVLKGFFLQKGQTLIEWSQKRVCPLQETRPTAESGQRSWKDRPYWILLDSIISFSPSSKLSLGPSNQPKLPIYPFWQSQCQIANLSPIL